jgi:transcription elongation GreA/GreB family factor
MSGAFIREQDGEGGKEVLTDRPISPHPNLVTPTGLARMDAEIARLRAEIARAESADEDHALALAERDYRYWMARRASAELVHPIADVSQVRFGHSVTLRTEDGETRRYHLVGEDEADPAQGFIPYVAPLGQALIGKSVGDGVEVAHKRATIVAIAAKA